jgi:GT2 family glycosyltransferase
MSAKRSKTFWTLLSLALRAQPAQALAAVGWLARGKRVRGWNILGSAAAAHPEYYRRWIRIAEPLKVSTFVGDRQLLPLPEIAVLILDSQDGDVTACEKSSTSVRAALGANATIIAPSQSQSISSLLQELHRNAQHKWLLPMIAGDLLSPYLGHVLGTELGADDQHSIIYWDEDSCIDGKRSDPWIKPDWDKLLFLARDCLSGSAVFRVDRTARAAADLADETIGGMAFARLVLRMIGQEETVPRHIPLILTHRRRIDGFASPIERCAAINSEWSQPLGCSTIAENERFAVIIPPSPGSWPSVSIIIPTKDCRPLLEACLRSLERLQYEGRTEIIIIDNGSTEADAQALLGRLADQGTAKVIDAPGPFNFSGLNNLAANQASGEYLCLLNNDVEAIDGTWLEAMVRHACVERTGAVGAHLLYPNGTIQHAGVSIGIGGAAGHVEKGRLGPGDGPAGWHSITREVSAVTAACMLVHRKVYEEFGGLDEKEFPVAFNDVDFCLRLKSRGYRIVLVNEARLIHHESVSRGNDLEPANLARFRKELTALQSRWKTESFRDPHFSPLFSKTSEQCLLAF